MSAANKDGPGLPARIAEDISNSTPDALSLKERLAAEIEAAGGEIPRGPELDGSIGMTMFDLPGSQDNTVTVVLPQQNAQLPASQPLVPIHSRHSTYQRTS